MNTKTEYLDNLEAGLKSLEQAILNIYNAVEQVYDEDITEDKYSFIHILTRDYFEVLQEIQDIKQREGKKK